MDEKLLDYLLDNLSAVERREVEDRLRDDPAMGDRLIALKKELAPLSFDGESPLPPSGLALDTLARLAEVNARRPVLRPAPPPRHETAGRRWFRCADVIAAAALLVLVGGVAASWLAVQWQQYRIEACQRNLAVFWDGLRFYSDIHQGSYPAPRDQGPRSFAGIVVPLLNDSGVLAQEASVLCPAVGKSRPDSRSVPELEDLWNNGGSAALRSTMRRVGGSYAYPLGYEEGGQLIAPQRDWDAGQPILADVVWPGDNGNSANHGGKGQNVLFNGGNVRWCTTRNVGPNGDDIYVNERNEVRAGLNRNDAVLGSGDASP